jgi:hypothetical protein
MSLTASTTSLLASSDTSVITPSQLALIGLIVAITALMLISTRRKWRESQNSPRSYTRELYKRLKEEKSTISDVQEVMLELEQLARNIHGQIDTRFAKMEKAIHDADERIEQLSRLIRAAGGQPAIDVTVTDKTATDPASDGDANDSAVAEAPHADVFRLADAGMAPAEIAKELGSPIGEVELILALRKTRRESAVSAAAGLDAAGSDHTAALP